MLTSRHVVVMFVFMALAFTLLAWRTEVNTDRIEENRLRQVYESCVAGREIIRQFDMFVRGMARIELRGTRPGSPTYDKTAVPARLEQAELYREAVIPLPVCEP